MLFHVDGLPEEATERKRVDAAPAKSKVLEEEKGCIQISIKKMLFFLQKVGLSYVGLKLLVERPEGPC